MLLTAVITAALTSPAADPPAKAFEFKDGDRIVWLGNTLVEREQRYGYWETALLAANKDKNITVRNLGWSGDTVFGDARAGFDNAAKGFERMVSLTLELKPTVIFVSFGTNEAFEGKDGLPKFEKGLEKLLDALKPANARVVLFTPVLFLPSPSLPDPAERNRTLVEYAGVIQKISEKRQIALVRLHRHSEKFIQYSQVLEVSNQGPKLYQLTENGMHLTGLGYELTAPSFLNSLGLPWEEMGKAAAEKHELLRKAVIAKNELFFYRWRPQNETYLFGFRKHEQGKNAKEIAEFDPLVSKAEEEIAKIRKTLAK